LGAEIQNVSVHGIWILINDKEFFLSFDKYPWFQNATIAQIYDFKCYRDNHLHWPSLDVDIDLKILQNPDAYPLLERREQKLITVSKSVTKAPRLIKKWAKSSRRVARVAKKNR